MSSATESYLIRVTNNVIGASGLKRMRDDGMEGTALFAQVFARLMYNEGQNWTWAVLGKLVDEIDQLKDHYPVGTAFPEYVKYKGKAGVHARETMVFHVAVFIHWRLMTPES
jgi:hypothetical protein